MRKPDGTRRGWLRSTRDARSEVRGWLDVLDVQIPKPTPIFLDWEMNEVDEAAWLADEDNVLRIDPDWPDRDDLADAVVGMVREADELFPPAWHWSRRDAVKAVSSWVYRLGITGSGGGCSLIGGDPVGGWINHLPPMASFRWKRQYVAGLPRWWWECVWRQVAERRKNGWPGWHRPEEPYAFGICAACLPCPGCGAHRDCADDCELTCGPPVAVEGSSTPAPNEERRP
jgi:hypothetical protein